VRALLAAGAAEAVDADNNSGWHLAAENGHTEVIRVLADQGGMDLESKGRYGMTALLLATWKGHGGIVRALLRAGADPEAMDEDGATARMLAERFHPALAGLLG
jgi:ankyrin repeat protein